MFLHQWFVINCHGLKLHHDEPLSPLFFSCPVPVVVYKTAPYSQWCVKVECVAQSAPNGTSQGGGEPGPLVSADPLLDLSRVSETEKGKKK